MEKIKNLLGVGGSENEHTTDTTDSTHHKSGLIGEGSHLSGSQNPSLPGKNLASVPSSTTNTTGLSGQGSHFSGNADNQSTGLGHGTHDPSLAARDNTRQGEALTGQSSLLPGSSTTGSTGHHTGGLTGQGSHLSGATDNTTSSTGLGHGSLDPGATRQVGSSRLGHGQHERSNPANIDTTAHGGSSGLGGDHTKTTSGPHSSEMLNKIDPRIDSDRSQATRTSDQTGNYSGTGTGVGHGDQLHSISSAHGNTTLPGHGISQGQKTTGPHSSDAINRADPRFNSEFSNTRRTADESGNFGGTSAGMATIGTSSHGNNTLGRSNQSQTTQGPHSSDLLNKLDPTVDSDNSKNLNSGVGHHSSTGSSLHPEPSGLPTSGPHQTNVANMLDPNVNTSGTGHEDAIHHHERHGGGAEEADNDHRNAGKKEAIAGAVGLGAIGMGSDNHQSRFTERGADGSAGGVTSMMPGTFPGESTHLTGNDFQTGTQNIPDRTRTANNPTSSVGEHHHGRDAALVGGAAGLGGAAHGASRHSGNQASEPVHNSDMLNRLDPRVTTDKSGTSHSSNLQDRSHDIMTGNTAGHQTSQTTSHSSALDSSRDQQHHLGRDAALGAGAVGAAGAGYGLGRQHDSHPQGSSTTITTGHQNIPQSSNVGGVSEQQRHHGRDAALGAGAVGAGYGLGHQHGSHPHGASTTTTTTTNTSTSTAGPYTSDTLNRADPRVDSDRSKEQNKDHHYGRDAGLVGGAGAAAIGAHELHDKREDKALKQAEKDHKQAEKDQRHAEKQHDKAVHADDKHEQDHAHEQKEHNKAVLAAEKERHHQEQERQKQLRDNEKRDVKDEKHAEKEHREHKGLFSFLHRDKSKKYTKEEEDDFARQEREYNSHPSNISNTLHGADAIGGSSLGDKLHGTARNRGIIGSTGYPEGGGPNDHINHHTGGLLVEPQIGSQQTHPHTGHSSMTAPHTAHSSTGTHYDENTHSHSRTGALGETKQSANEYNSSRSQQGDILSPTTDSYAHTGPGSSNTHTQSSNTDAAPRHLTSEQKADTSGNGVLDSDTGVKTQQGVQTGESHGAGVTTGDDGRNRLHKNPPIDGFQ